MTIEFIYIHFMRYITFVLLLGLSILPALAITQADKAKEQNILLKGNGPECTDLDPHTATGLPEQKVLLALFEGLLSLDPKDCSPLPGVATHWEVSEDGAVYTFFLRPQALWSNSDPVCADDFVFSAKRALSPRLGADLANFFYPIKNAKDYHQGSCDDFSQVGIQAISSHILRIQLEKPNPCFLQFLARSAWYPVHQKAILAKGAIDQRSTGWARPTSMINNGPFLLKKWELGKAIIVEKNPLYWNADQVCLHAIHFISIPDLGTEERAFRAGQLHITEGLPANKYKGLIEKKAKELMIAPSLGTYCYAFNTQKPPFDDVRIRQAFSLALDRKALVEHVAGTGKLPAYSFVPSATAGYTSENVLGENILRARELLKEAGFQDGRGFPKVRLLFNTSDSHKNMAEAIQAMWFKNLNIQVELVNEEWKVFLNSRKYKDFEIVRANWMADYLDPLAFLEVYTTQNPNNHSGWFAQNYDAAIQASENTTDAKRYDYLQQAEAILLEQLPVLPIYYFNTVNLLDPNVKGWCPNFLDLHPYQYVYFED